MANFYSEQECAEYLNHQLDLSGRNEFGIAELLTAAVSMSHVVDDCSAPDALLLKLGQWVVRDDDLDAMKAVRDGVFALAAAKFALPNAGAATVTAVVYSILSLVRNAYRNGSTLSPNQVAVLLALRSERRPMKASEIAGRLGRPWSAASVSATLASLTKLPTKNGYKAMVTSSESEQWITNGI